MSFKVVLIISLIMFVLSLSVNIFAHFLEKSMEKKKKNIIHFKNENESK